jgi:chromosome segregation protein
MNELKNAEEEWTRLTKETSEIEERMREIEKIREDLRLKEINLTSEKSTITERLRNINIEITNLETLLQESLDLKEVTLQKLTNEKAKHDPLEKHLTSIFEELRKREQELDSLKNKLERSEREFEESTSKRNRLEKEIELVKVKINEMEEKNKSIEEESSQNLDIIAQKIQERRKILDTYKVHLDKLKKLELKLEHLDEEYNRLRNILLKAQEIEKNLSRIMQTIDSLGFIEKRRLEEKVNHILNEVDGVYGFLKNWIDVEDYEMLIKLEAGTSGWIHSLIVDRWKMGIQLAEIFHQAGLKVKIIPLETMTERARLRIEGFKPKTKWAEEIMSQLLKNVLFKKKIELPQNPNIRIVDSKGIISYPDGRIEVTSTVMEQDIIQLECEYNESIKVLDQIKTKIEKLQSHLYLIEEEKRQLYDEKSKVNLEKELKEIAINKNMEEIFNGFLRLASLSLEKIKLKKELLEARSKLERYVEELGRIKQADKSEIQFLKNEVKKSEEEFLNISTKRKEIEIELRETSRLIQEYSREYERSEAQINNAKSKIEDKKNEKQELERKLEDILTQYNLIQADLKNYNDELNSTIFNIQQRKVELEKFSLIISSIRNELRVLESRLQESTNKRLSIAVRRSQLESEMRKIKEELDSLPSQDFPDIPREEIEEIENELSGELKELEKINQLAPQQYEEIIGNYKLRSQRIREIEEERDEILRFINWIEEEKKKVFMSTFNKVSESFERFFFMLTGGQAWLKLEDPENPFSKGVEMILRFPGKSARSARSASGGEKSVAAVALLLALQGLTPAEFYIFDEVDAHMDVQYSIRLAELFEEMSKKTQIIVISLKDVIAEKSDQLIGVYNRNSESRIVKMNIDEVASHE